jgi:hypothetical protein
MNTTRSQQERARSERERGWIIFLLYNALPRSLEVASLRSLLDARNIPLASHRLSNHLVYLRELRLVSVTVGATNTSMDDSAQERALQRYADSDREGLNEAIYVRLTAAGTNFQEGSGNASYDGISRVE